MRAAIWPQRGDIAVDAVSSPMPPRAGLAWRGRTNPGLTTFAPGLRYVVPSGLERIIASEKPDARLPIQFPIRENSCPFVVAPPHKKSPARGPIEFGRPSQPGWHRGPVCGGHGLTTRPKHCRDSLTHRWDYSFASAPTSGDERRPPTGWRGA